MREIHKQRAREDAELFAKWDAIRESIPPRNMLLELLSAGTTGTSNPEYVSRFNGLQGALRGSALEDCEAGLATIAYLHGYEHRDWIFAILSVLRAWKRAKLFRNRYVDLDPPTAHLKSISYSHRQVQGFQRRKQV